MNTRAQTGIMTGFFLLAVFIVCWALGLGSMFSTNGNVAIASGNLSGTEAWLVGNWNLIILICVIIATLGIAYGFTSGGSQ